MNNFELTYIEPSNSDIKHIKELIKNQGSRVCRNQISSNFISKNANSFTFGWITASRKAQLGRRSIKNINDQFNLSSFILCTYNINVPSYLIIDLICSTVKSGNFLIELVENKARDMNVKIIQIFFLINDKLKIWYESLGFVYISTINSDDGQPKVYSMIKNII